MFGGFEMWHVHSLKNKDQNVQAQLASDQNSLYTLIQNNRKIVYQVNGTGAQQAESAQVVNLSHKIAALMTTWNSESEYNSNRSALQSYVSDPNFFNNIMGSDIDKTNESYIKVSKVKSDYGSSFCYQLPNNRFMLIVRFYLYTDSDTLSDISQLKPSFIAISFTSDGQTIKDVQLVPGIGLQNEK